MRVSRIMYILHYFFYIFFTKVCWIVWFLIKVIPDKYVYLLAKNRPWRFLKIELKPHLKSKIRKKIIYFLNIKSNKIKLSNPCLAIAITGRIFFDLFAIENILNLGINKLPTGISSPHAWLSNLNGDLLTPGLTSKKNVTVIKI